MAIPTALIGILPTYTQIGETASVILIMLRLLQGISMGNYAGSITFTTEHSQQNRRGFNWQLYRNKLFNGSHVRVRNSCLILKPFFK